MFILTGQESLQKRSWTSQVSHIQTCCLAPGTACSEAEELISENIRICFFSRKSMLLEQIFTFWNIRSNNSISPLVSLLIRNWLKEDTESVICFTFQVNQVKHYLKSAQQKRPACAAKTFTFIPSNLCFTVRKASLSLEKGNMIRGCETWRTVTDFMQRVWQPLKVCRKVDFIQPILVLKHPCSDLEIF